MDLSAVLSEIQSHPKISQAGMVLIHLGVVRSFNLKGEEVKGLELSVDEARAEALRAEALKKPGIIEAIVRFNPGNLKVGDPIMLAAVAGQTRGETFPALEELVDRLKKEATFKKEELA